MGKKFLAALVCLVLVFALLPKTARADDEITVDLANGYIRIASTGAGSAFAVYQNGASVPIGSGTLSGTQVRISGTYNAPATGPINVPIDVDVSNSTQTLPVKITLDNVTIGDAYWLRDIENNALKLNANSGDASHVLLTLKGTNTLKSSSIYAAVHVPIGASLTIQGDGRLNAIGGSPGGAGIGGSNAGQKDCGSVTIKSGTIKASGGGHGGAGIGGSGTGSSGNGGNGGNITITGGTVMASGGGSTGAGIGGGGVHDSNSTGNGGAGGTITITGGMVYAWDGGLSGQSNRGAAIGGGGCLGSGSGSVGADATVRIGSFAYEWVYSDHVGISPNVRSYTSGPLSDPPDAISNLLGFVGIRQPLTVRPASGTYGRPVSVAITSPFAGAIIKYTLDGSDPKTSPSAQTYSAPFTVMSNVQVKAYAEDHDPIPTGHQNDSAVVTAVYTIDVPVPKAGDETPLALLIGLVLLSGAGLAVSMAVKRWAAKQR